MQALLDTRAVLWWPDGDERLSPRARTFIRDSDNQLMVSAASAWEIATKVRLGKLPGAIGVAVRFLGCLLEQGFTPLGISVEHALRAGSLPEPRRDPFGQMLIAQAQDEHISLIRNKSVFDSYGIQRLW